MQNSSVVYVEDEEDYQRLVSRILGKAGLPVQVADTGEKGIELLRRENPGLLLLDINLPDTDGFSICRRLREEAVWKNLPILMLTVRRQPQEWRNGFSCGANDYISKPLNPPEFLERVQSCLQGKSISPILGPDDAEFQLVQAAAAGNRGAFEVLVRQFQMPLLQSISSQLRDDSRAEDIVSAAFVTAFEQLGQFQGNSSFQTYLTGIALNILSRERRGPTLIPLADEPDDSNDIWLAENDPALERLEREPDLTCLKQAFGEMSGLHRKILQMGIVENIEPDEIARRLKIAKGTVWSRLTRAKRRFRHAWKISSFKRVSADQNNVA